MNGKKSESARQMGFSNLFVASISLSDPLRARAFSSLYSLMQVADDLSEMLNDDPSLKGAALRSVINEINKLNRQITACYRDSRDSSHFNLSILQAISMFGIPEKIWTDFFSSKMMRISPEGFKTFDELKTYSQGAAGVPLAVFLTICLSDRTDEGVYEFKYRDQVMEVVEDLGLWCFMIHILSVAKKYFTRKSNPRNLFPTELIVKHHLTFDELVDMARKGLATKEAREMAREFLGIAKAKGRNGIQLMRKLISEIPRDQRNALTIALAVYSEIAWRITQRDYDIFSEPPIWRHSDRAKLISVIEKCSTPEELFQYI